MRAKLSPRQEKALGQMREVLGDQFVTLEVVGYDIRERFREEHCEVTCELIEQPAGRELKISGEGVGMIDAFFRAVQGRYEQEHPSLASLQVSSFSVKGLMSEPHSETAWDAKAEARVGLTNSYGTEFEFVAISPSVSHSSLEAVVSTVEYFLNSERAYITIYRAIEHYKKQRPELVPKYTALLAEMVRNTSYSEVIERLKK